MTSYFDPTHRLSYKIGQPEDRYTDERNDCTVLTLVNAFKIPYSLAHYELAKRAGRKNGKGAYFFKFIRSFIKPGESAGLNNYTVIMFNKKVTQYQEPKMLIRTFVQKNPRGVFMVQHRGHVFAVVDGVIHDGFQTRATRRVTCYWKVEDINSDPTPETTKTRKAYAARTGKSQKDRVMELYHQGKTVQEIVDLTGIQKPNVQCYISKNKNK